MLAMSETDRDIAKLRAGIRQQADRGDYDMERGGICANKTEN